MKKILEEIIKSNRPLIEEGEVADYIPALASADRDKIAVSIFDMEGNCESAGDSSHRFTIQSISKVLSLILAIMDNGEEEVFKWVGYEATDEPFNSLLKLELPHTEKPTNPMINAGAIVTTSLIHGKGEERFERLLSFFRKVSGNDKLDYNREVYMSEKETGDKNRAIAYLMKSRGFIEGDVEEILDIYFKQCSIEVNTVELAKIGLYIAKRDEDLHLNKIKRIASSIMATSGMYNFSGEYASDIGIPSKSGVAGGIMASVPCKMGIAVYNPALDPYGNSVAGRGMMKDISKKFKLDIF